MDFLTMGILGFGVYATYLASCKLGDIIYPLLAKNNIAPFDETPYILARNGLEDYKVVETNDLGIGKEVIIEVPPLGSFKKLNDLIPMLEKQFKGKIFIDNVPFSDVISMTIITKDVGEINYKFMDLSPFQLLNGYDFKGKPIITDMLLTPHLLVTGLSGNGKTGMLRIMINNLILNNNVDIMLLNAFMDDYEGFILRHITDHKEIKSFIQELLQGIERGEKRNKPLYVIFEELGKVKDKELIDLTTKLLQYGRHNKIYLIGVIQTATKEELKFKSLFNARLTFKQLEESSYRVVLGCSIEEKLKKREFYLFTDDLYKGKTYKLDF